MGIVNRRDKNVSIAPPFNTSYHNSQINCPICPRLHAWSPGPKTCKCQYSGRLAPYTDNIKWHVKYLNVLFPAGRPDPPHLVRRSQISIFRHFAVNHTNTWTHLHATSWLLALFDGYHLISMTFSWSGLQLINSNVIYIWCVCRAAERTGGNRAYTTHHVRRPALHAGNTVTR